MCGAGVVDVDPPFAWNCQVVAGAGVVKDIRGLYKDMHSYLAGEHYAQLAIHCLDQENTFWFGLSCQGMCLHMQ